MLDILLFIIAALMGAAIIHNIRKYVMVYRLMKAYPPYGGVTVKLPFTRYLCLSHSEDSATTGTFSPSTRILMVAMRRPLLDVMETYLHERRHSEQWFGGNVALYNMVAGEAAFLSYIDSRGDLTPREQRQYYYNAAHEVDAREWAAKTLKEFLGR